MPSTEGLPVAVHDAVIGALLPGPDAVPSHAGLLEHDLVLYADRGGAPVAVLPGRNFLRAPTVVAAATTTGEWTLVLTPARKTLPSVAGPSRAPAQTAAWARTSDLPTMQPTAASVTVRVAEQSMTITTTQGQRRHEVGVGQDSTPTPTGVSGYLQARYVDPAQALAPGAIQLTSLHATAADEPYTGTDGGLIAIHANPNPRGRASHGCIRVRTDAVAELDALPLGTPIVVLP
ncbi:L,D-transpeptidase [Curtobacterium sp. HSID17257]|uniref:L,D-transpeptidase n=1 Tax=Curtobacterium sp. HSID17257 TaxID=2419510 RepID=UPI000F88AD35|nr:L,D-transpeptidase [Curtobacterium sp. HSID17257]